MKSLRLNVLATTMVLLGAAALDHPVHAQIPVSIDTGALNGQGTYYLDFQLFDGSGLGAGDSTATISGLSFSGGGFGGAEPITGTAAGDPTTMTGLTLSDSDAMTGGFTEYLLPFSVTSAPSSLSFNVGLSSTTVDTPTPDTFNFLILQNDESTALPTGGPTGVELASASYTSSSPALFGYATTMDSPVPLTTYVNGMPPAPAPVPELPSSVSLLGMIVFLGAMRGSVRRRSRV